MREMLRTLLHPGDRLAHRAMNAGVWALGLRITLRILLLVRTVILARLLAPDDFGLMAIATLVILLFDRLSQMGFDSALVQQKGDIRSYLDTAWTFQIARATAIALMLLVAAPVIAGIFDAPDVEPIVRALSIAVILRGLASLGVVDFWRELRFSRFSLLQVSDKLADVVVSIIAAIILGNAWALVFGVIAGSLTGTITSYLIHPYRPKLRWNRAQAGELFGFGKWVMAATVLTYTVNNLDDILVGRILGVAALGFYRMAYNFSQAVSTEISHTVSPVAFPTYSKLQDDPPRLRTAYMGTLHLVAFLAFPVAAGTALVATDLTIGVLGDKWAPMISALQLLSIAGLARALMGTTNSLFKAKGKPHIATVFAAVELALLSILLVPAINAFDIEGAAGIVAITSTLAAIPALAVAFRFVGVRGSHLTQSLGFPILNTAVMTGFVLLGIQLLPGRPSAVSFLTLMLIGAISYFGSVALTVRSGRYRAPKEIFAKLREQQTSS